MYRTGVKISIVEPGAFKTPIFKREAIRSMAEAKIASLPADIRANLPNDAVEQRKHTCFVLSLVDHAPFICSVDFHCYILVATPSV